MRYFDRILSAIHRYSRIERILLSTLLQTLLRVARHRSRIVIRRESETTCFTKMLLRRVYSEVCSILPRATYLLSQLLENPQHQLHNIRFLHPTSRPTNLPDDESIRQSSERDVVRILDCSVTTRRDVRRSNRRGMSREGNERSEKWMQFV